MSLELTTEQRIFLWKQVLIELTKEDLICEEANGICFYAIREYRRITGDHESTLVTRKYLPELIAHKPPRKLDWEIWWPKGNIKIRIKVVKEIINQLETEQSTVIAKT